MRRDGFTLLEVLVASVLMGMLVTILTMIFNQSAIAWRTGKAGVADMSQAERNLSRIHFMADSILPYMGENYCAVSPWDDSNGNDTGNLQRRGLRKASELEKGLDTVSGNFGNDRAGDSSWLKSDLGSPNQESGANFVVGVRSWGPDGKEDTADDITTWPDEVE